MIMTIFFPDGCYGYKFIDDSRKLPQPFYTPTCYSSLPPNSFPFVTNNLMKLPKEHLFKPESVMCSVPPWLCP